MMRLPDYAQTYNEEIFTVVQPDIADLEEL